MPKLFKYEVDISSLVIHDGEDILPENHVSSFCDIIYTNTNRKINNSIAIVYFNKETLKFFEQFRERIQLFLLCDNGCIYEISPTDISQSIDSSMDVCESYVYVLRTDDVLFASKLKIGL